MGTLGLSAFPVAAKVTILLVTTTRKGDNPRYNRVTLRDPQNRRKVLSCLLHQRIREFETSTEEFPQNRIVSYVFRQPSSWFSGVSS